MNNYSKPIVIENNDAVEGVYAYGSGTTPNYQIYLKWTNQNSGSHSDLEGGIITGPNMTGNYIKITCTFVGKGNIVSWGGTGGAFSATTSGNSITFVRNGAFNPNEDLNFSFNNVVFDQGEISDDGHSGSYYKTGTHIQESAIIDGTWNVEVTVQ